VPDIRLRDVVKTYDDHLVLDKISLDVGDKEFVTLLGPSGCGKTTTLMAIAGFQHPDAGLISCGDEVFFEGSSRRVKAPERRNLGIVFQSYALWPHMTVAGNVGFPLAVRRFKKPAVARRVAEVLELVELAEVGQQYPHQLSGGQQQRVALARALSSSPLVLLLDEPFSNLDAKLRERSRKWLRELQREIGITTVFVTHDQHEALGLSDRVMIMDRGVIQQSGTPEEVYLRPVNRTVAGFVGRCNFLDAEIVDTGAAGGAIVRINGTPLVVRAHCARTLSSGSDVVIAVRPEAIQVSSADSASNDAGNQCRGDVRSGAFLGDHFEYEMAIGKIGVMVQTNVPVTSAAVLISLPDDASTVIE
jgi:iron(III) transport system ATP-binding protein